MKRIDVKSLAIGLLMGAAAVFAIGAAAEGPKDSEYHVIAANIYTGDYQRRLNNAAADGWQLVQADGLGNNTALAVMSRPRR